MRNELRSPPVPPARDPEDLPQMVATGVVAAINALCEHVLGRDVADLCWTSAA